MRNDTTVFVGLDVHKDSIVAAYAIGAGEIQDLGNIGVLQRDLDRLCARMRAKGSQVRFVYEAGPCGYSVYRYLTAKGVDCTVCAPSLIARKPGWLASSFPTRTRTWHSRNICISIDDPWLSVNGRSAC